MLLKTGGDIKAAISPSVLLSGCVHVIDLAPIRDGAGTIWEKIKDGLHARLECILRQRLAATDFFSGISPTRFIVVTPHSNAEESAVTCLRILHELTTTMLGRCQQEQICIERAYEIDNDGLRSERFSSAIISHLAAKAQLADLANGVEMPVEEPAAATAFNNDLEITHRFEPIWDSRHEAITTYMCIPQRVVAEGQEPAPLSMKERIRFELSALSTGAAHLTRSLENGERFMLGVRLSFETLGSPYGRMEIAGICRNLPAACRQYLVFLITDIPHGVAHSRMTDFVMTLGHFGRIIATVPSGTRNFSAYQGLGLFGIAMDFSAAHASAERISADIAQLTLAGRNLRMTTLAYGVQDRMILAHAYASSVQIMHGPAIGAALNAPKPMTHLRWRELAPQRARRAMAERVEQVLAVA